MPQENDQSPEEVGIDTREAANQIAGLLDDDGHFNPNPDQISRAHPDYDETADERSAPQGRDERGHFKKKAAATEDQDDLEDAAIDDDSDEDTDLPDDIEDGDTDEDQDQSADEDSNSDDADTEDPIETLEQLAEAMEVPLDEITSQLTHTFRAAGEEVTVTLAELEAGYQKDADYRRNSAKLADDRRDAETDYQNRMQSYEQENYVLANTLLNAENMIAGELDSPAMQALRQSDPAEWAARREEIGNRLGQLRGARQQAATQYQTFRTQQLQELKTREMSRLKEIRPDFSKEDGDTARKVMESVGYNQMEISQIFDHRLVNAALELHTLREANAQFKAEKDKAQNTVKRVKKEVPKVTKPGKKATSKRGISRDKVSNLRRRAAQSGKVEDAAKVIETML